MDFEIVYGAMMNRSRKGRLCRSQIQIDEFINHIQIGRVFIAKLILSCCNIFTMS